MQNIPGASITLNLFSFSLWLSSLTHLLNMLPLGCIFIFIIPKKTHTQNSERCRGEHSLKPLYYVVRLTPCLGMQPGILTVPAFYFVVPFSIFVFHILLFFYLFYELSVLRQNYSKKTKKKQTNNDENINNVLFLCLHSLTSMLLLNKALKLGAMKINNNCDTTYLVAQSKESKTLGKGLNGVRQSVLETKTTQ